MIKAVIFDMDGVISDTQKLHAQVESELLRRYGVNISPSEISRRFAGVNTQAWFSELLKEGDKPYDIDELVKEKWEHMAMLAAQSVNAVDGSIDLIKRLHNAGYKKAVASGSNYDYVKNVINKLGIQEYFEFLASGDMVAQGKPSPDIFLLAASKIGVDPEHCLVIEDGTSGMKAAMLGKMKCIGLVESKEKEYPTNNLVCALHEITPEYLENLI